MSGQILAATIRRSSIDVIIPSFRRGTDPKVWSDLLVCLASCHAYADDLPVLVGWDGEVDPSSHLETSASALSAMSTFKRRPSGLSGPAAYTWCAREVSRDILFLLNDDAVLMPDTVDKLVEDWNSLVTTGIRVGFLTARSNCVAGVGNIREPNGGARQGVQFTTEHQVIEVPTAFPVAALIRRNAYLEEDGFEPSINWYADNLLAYDLKKKGYRHFVSRAYVHHIGQRGTVAESAISMAEENARSLAWLQIHRPDYYHHLQTVGV